MTVNVVVLVDLELQDVRYVWQFRVAAEPGGGFFFYSGQAFGDERSFDVALGDLDSDGDLDDYSGHLTQADTVQVISLVYRVQSVLLLHQTRLIERYFLLRCWQVEVLALELLRV